MTIKSQSDKKTGFLYLLKIDDTYKIGITRNIEKRMASYRREVPFNIEIKRYYISNPISGYKLVEKIIKDKYKGNVIMGEEWFMLTDQERDDIISFIKSKEN